MDFFEITGPNLDELTRSEMKIYNYILEHIGIMHTKTVRAIARECYVSTSTILRLVKKIGFEGYNEMIVVIKFTLNTKQMNLTTITKDQIQYKEEYAKNILETIRVMDNDVTLELVNRIRNCNTLYVFTRGLLKSYGTYIEFLFELKGVDTYFPNNSYFRSFYKTKITSEDVVMIIDYQGDDEELISVITKAKAVNCQNIITITQANNNVMQNLSDYNLYYFSDESVVNGFDITSNISVMAILELLVHNL